MSEKKQELLELLKIINKGKSNSITSHELCDYLEVKSNDVRIMVNTLRREGHPICSDSTGYYYAGNKKEIEATINQLQSRVKGINDAIKGLNNFLAMAQS